MLQSRGDLELRLDRGSDETLLWPCVRVVRRGRHFESEVIWNLGQCLAIRKMHATTAGFLGAVVGALQ